MTLGHVYLIDISKTDPSYLKAMQEFLSAFSNREGGYAVDVNGKGECRVGIKNGSLDSSFHAYFITKTRAVEIRLGEHESKLSFPPEPFALRDKITPGEAPRAEGSDQTEVATQEIEAFKAKIDEAHGR